MRTKAILIGGASDGRELDPENPKRPDDWPDWIEMPCGDSGQVEQYTLEGECWPETKPGWRIYRYYCDALIMAMEQAADEARQAEYENLSEEERVELDRYFDGEDDDRHEDWDEDN